MDEIEKEVTSVLLKYIYPDDWSAEKKKEHPIDAREIGQAIKDGKKVEIINAVITGAFILKSVNVEGEITIQGTTIEGLLDWSYSTFERVLNLENSTFETDATFTESNFKKSIDFYKSTFEGKSEFASTQIGCSANFNEAMFKKLASFNGAHIGGFALFRSAIFKGEVDFVSARINRNAEFTRAVFVEPANFIGAHIEGAVTFAGALFKEPVNFNSSQIVGAALFNPTTFKDDADFRNIRIGSNAEFTGAMFEKNADFSSAQIEGIALFDPEYLFNWDDDQMKIIKLVEYLNRNCDIKNENTVGINNLFITLNDEKNKAVLKSDVYGTYLFSWNDIPGNDNEKLIEFLKKRFDIEWPDNAKIEKIDGGKTIRLNFETSFICLKLNDDGTKVNLKIDDGRDDEFIAKIEKDKLNIDYGTYEFIVKTENNKLNIYNPIAFKDEVDFISAQIGTAIFNEVVFKERVSFNKAQIKESAFFNSASFNGKADFGYAQIGSNAEFTRALFKKSASFNSAKIEEGAFFNPATFERVADFVNVRIGNAEFASTSFKKLASFNSSQIEGSAKFNLTTFEIEADFINARIGGNAEFFGVVFKEQASFYGYQIEGSGFFSQAYLFSWDGILGEDNEKFIEFLKLNYAIGLVTPKIEKSYDGATIKVMTKNNQIVLILNNEKSKVRLTTDNKTDEFITKTGNNKLKIYKSTIFGGETSFTRARFGGDARFYGTIFGNNLSFRDTFFGTIYFGEPKAEEPDVEFQAKIDLRGCIYNRIHPVSVWKPMMECLNPYDRQPFTQLEETFRRAGRDQLADDVHYGQKSREFTENITIQKPGVWLLDRFLWLLTGYGVRSHRLLLAIVPILVIGTAIFQLEGAVQLNMQPHYMISTQATLSCLDAFWVSLNTFLPIEIPSGTDWIPSSQIIPGLGLKFSTFATFSNLVGWILVPVGVAGISGLLKGSKKQ